MNAHTALRLTSGLALAIGLTSAAHAFSGCTNNSLYGTYGLQLSGAVTPEAAGGVGDAQAPDKARLQMSEQTPRTPNTAAGFARLYMDGAGNLFGNANITISGAWSEGPVSGTYNVNDDCTATITLTDSSGAAQHFDAVVVSRGDGAVLRQNDPGVAMSGSMSRARNSCQPSDIGGYFGFRSNGALQNSGPFSSIGSLFLDADGTVTLSESRFSNGASSEAASTGTITLSLDCTVTLSLASVADGSLATYRGIVVNNLKELLLVRADDGASVTGNIVAQ
jgi:hypothetical protein